MCSVQCSVQSTDFFPFQLACSKWRLYKHIKLHENGFNKKVHTYILNPRQFAIFIWFYIFSTVYIFNEFACFLLSKSKREFSFNSHYSYHPLHFWKIPHNDVKRAEFLPFHIGGCWEWKCFAYSLCWLLPFCWVPSQVTKLITRFNLIVVESELECQWEFLSFARACNFSSDPFDFITYGYAFRCYLNFFI